MQKDDLVYAGHMLDMARKALRLVRGKSRSEYEQDETLSLALTHLLQVIGEAARKRLETFERFCHSLSCCCRAKLF